jgi:hypothetical protein
MGKLLEHDLLDGARERIDALRAEYADLVDSEGNILRNELHVDGNNRLTHLDPQDMPVPMLLAAKEAAAQQMEAYAARRARMTEYMGGLRAIVTDLSRAIDEAEAEVDPADAEQATEVLTDAVHRATRFDEDMLRELSHGGDS